jgi:hypothetical protein
MFWRGGSVSWDTAQGSNRDFWIKRPAISRVEPVLESNLEALEHLFFDAFDVSELAPPSHITAFS